LYELRIQIHNATAVAVIWSWTSLHTLQVKGTCIDIDIWQVHSFSDFTR